MRAILVLMAALLAASAHAQQPARDFYRGKTLHIIVPFTPGGYYDLAARLVAKNLPAYLDAQVSSVVVQNQPGGGGISATNRLAQTIDKDGLTFATVSRGLPQLAMVGDPNVAFDPLKFTWLGSLSSYADDAYFLTVMSSHWAKTLADVQGAKKIHLGGVGLGSTNTTFALIARDLLRVNMDEVRGFPGAADIWLAMERGEIDGQVIDLSAIMAARPQLWREGKLRVLAQFGRKTRLPAAPDAPAAREIVTNAADRELLEFAESPFFIALPFAAPPDIPADRAAFLREGFMKMARAPEFREEMLRAGFLTSPIDAKAVLDEIVAASKASPEVKARMGKLLLPK